MARPRVFDGEQVVGVTAVWLNQPEGVSQMALTLVT